MWAYSKWICHLISLPSLVKDYKEIIAHFPEAFISRTCLRALLCEVRGYQGITLDHPHNFPFLELIQVLIISLHIVWRFLLITREIEAQNFRQKESIA